MNMGPRTWYQVPSRDLRYPEDPHLQYGLPPMSQAGMKRNAEGAGLDMMEPPESSDEDSTDQKPLIHGHLGDHDDFPPGIGRGKQSPANTPVPQGKKTKGRVKIKMEFIDNKLRRYTTFSKRKTGIMKKAYELSTLTGTQVMLLVASETGHVYTFATRKLQPMITSEAGKALIQTCLNTPDEGVEGIEEEGDQRMCAEGFEETELMYAVDNENEKNWHTDYTKGSDDDEYWENEDDTSESDKPTNLSLNKDRDSPPLSNPEQKPTAKRKITKNSNSRDLLQP